MMMITIIIIVVISSIPTDDIQWEAALAGAGITVQAELAFKTVQSHPHGTVINYVITRVISLFSSHSRFVITRFIYNKYQICPNFLYFVIKE